ncbi:MAG: disulfide bond formation protein B [Gemmataceae bacterium]
MSIEPRTPPPAGPLTLLSLAVAAAASACSVYLTLVLDLVPCPLCLYQRGFAFGAFAVLAVGVTTGMGRTTALAALALPLAVAGLTVAGFHVYLERSGVLECPAGVLGLGTAPQQSLAAFALLTLLLLSDTWQDLRPGGGWSASLGGILLGVVLALMSLFTAPKRAPAPTSPYTEELKTCRPPYAPRD